MSISSKTVECIRRVENMSNISLNSRFDKKTFNPEEFIMNLKYTSPKMIALMKNIKKIDERDISKDKTLYKHFIFSDVKGGYGGKIIASLFSAIGFNLCIKKQGSKIVLDDDVLENDSYNNFAILSSTALWNNSIELDFIKSILNVFNDPDNAYGKNIRFIIVDSAFKEGIDLFDVKYGHIFEQQLYKSDVTQAVGRGTRFCGQKNLPYVNNEGWKLKVFTYKVSLPSQKSILPFSRKTPSLIDLIISKDKDLLYNMNIQDNLLKNVQKKSVDYYLNKKMNNN